MADVGALDLSAKHDSLKRESPALSPASSTLDQDRQQEQYLQRLPQRSASVSSGDGHDTDSSASGPSNGKPVIPIFPGMPPMIPLPQANLDLDPGELAGLRGFKNPLDGFGGGMFPNMAMSQGQQGLFPGLGGNGLNSHMGLGAMGGLSTLGLMDTNPISLSSPITQYLQQRRRRSESRLHSATESATSVNPTGTPMSPPGPSTSVSPPSTSPTTPQPPSSVASFPNTSTGTADDDLDDDSGGEPQSKKSRSLSTIEELRDKAYWDRRRKNNEAAKRSRDSRRAKEEEIALRAAFLEQENLKLRAQVAILKNETAKLHYMLYNRA